MAGMFLQGPQQGPQLLEGKDIIAVKCISMCRYSFDNPKLTSREKYNAHVCQCQIAEA